MQTKILYEDNYIMVAHKPAGIAVQAGRVGQADVESELKNYLAAKGGVPAASGKPYLGIVHRLDQPVEGLLVFAKTPKAAAALNRQLAGDSFGKDYLAVVCGKPEPKKQVLTDYIKKEGGTAIICPLPATGGTAPLEPSKTGKPGIPKKAELSYEVLTTKSVEEEEISMLAVRLKTGRFHQIRAQLSHAGYPLLGDAKYGSEKSCRVSQNLQVRNVALCAVHLLFYHPVTGEKKEYTVSPGQPVFTLLHA